jgi:hypothetical protein
MSTACKGDIGTIIAFDVAEDISTATLLKLKYKKPDNSTGFWIADPYGLTGMGYITLADDLDVAGRWKVQAYVEMPGWKGHSSAMTFDVDDVVA